MKFRDYAARKVLLVRRLAKDCIKRKVAPSLMLKQAKKHYAYFVADVRLDEFIAEVKRPGSFVA